MLKQTVTVGCVNPPRTGLDPHVVRSKSIHTDPTVLSRFVKAAIAARATRRSLAHRWHPSEHVLSDSTAKWRQPFLLSATLSRMRRRSAIVIAVVNTFTPITRTDADDHNLIFRRRRYSITRDATLLDGSRL